MPAIIRTSKKAQRIAEDILGLPKNAPRKRNRKARDKADNDSVKKILSIDAGAII